MGRYALLFWGFERLFAIVHAELIVVRELSEESPEFVDLLSQGACVDVMVSTGTEHVQSPEFHSILACHVL